jgi:hypothetical protein
MGNLLRAKRPGGAGIAPPPPYMERMPEAWRDTTDEWRLPPERTPPLLSELEERIDEALAVARASEAAVMTVGAAALDAAEQARRAANLAERASATMLAAGRPPRAPARRPGSSPEPEDEGLRDFSARADRVAERLRQLQRLPAMAGG